MNKWNTTQQLGVEISKLEKSSNGELNISQCNTVAKNIKDLYKHGGKDNVIMNLRETLPFVRAKNGFTFEQKNNIEEIVAKLFKNHWSPFSRIRKNMVRIGATK